MKSVAIIGAGWAGLAAATALANHAHVTLFEAGRVAGGRARQIAKSTEPFDNGQHILIGAYRETLALLNQFGVDTQKAFLRQPLHWIMRSPTDRVEVKMPAWPTPWHWLGAGLFTRGLSWSARGQLLRAVSALIRCRFVIEPAKTVAQWLTEQSQADALIERFWEPLTLATLNTPIANASMAVLATVLRDSLAGRSGAADFMIPRKTLTEIFVAPAQTWLTQQGADFRFSQRIQAGQLTPTAQGVEIAGEPFDAAIIAVAPHHVPALIEHEPMWHDLADTLKAWPSGAITTIQLYYSRPPRFEQAMLGFAGGVVQWAFDRSALDGQHGWISVVISCSETKDKNTLVEQVIHELDQYFQCGKPVISRLFTEKRATFLCQANMARPQAHIAPHVWLAGDYLLPEYPATLESAVRSGLAAAHALMKH